MSREVELKRSLQRAAGLLQRNDPAGARRLLESLARSHGHNPDCIHLLGLACKAQGDLPAAERHLRAALSLQPRSPVILGNLANLLKQTERLTEAEALYRQALDLAPEFSDAQRNLALLLAATGRDEEAVRLLEHVVANRPQDVGAWTTLGQCQRRLGEFERSARSFETALARRPDHANALAGLGQTLRFLGQPEQAARCFDRALAVAGEGVELLLARGDANADQGRYDEALAHYRRAVQLEPTHVAAHVQLSELLWQLGSSPSYGESFAAALGSHPDSAPLLAAWCRGLTATGAGEAALQELERRPQLVAGHPELLMELGIRLAARNQGEGAVEAFQRALGMAPEDPQLNLEFARLCIYFGDYARALAALEVVERARPEDQLMWACRGLCWRLMGDERAAWLNDEDRFVGTFEIDCPPGYGTLDGFLAALAETLHGLHRTQTAPAHQSLRGGTQTAPLLFFRPERVIQDLRQALTAAVRRYVDALPADDAHPLLRRRRRQFRFAGSWSVRLRSGGFHVNHVHPQGWISSSFYVTVPAAIGTGADQPAGWLKFGESGLGLGSREIVSRVVRPEPGQVTLFPSYFWHGTVPFESEEPRLTAPFDVVPAG